MFYHQCHPPVIAEIAGNSYNGRGQVAEGMYRGSQPSRLNIRSTLASSSHPPSSHPPCLSLVSHRRLVPFHQPLFLVPDLQLGYAHIIAPRSCSEDIE